MPAGYEINQRAVDYLLYGKVPTSDIIPIYPELRRRAESVQRRAIALVGKDSGRLAANIELDDFRVPSGWHFRVSANTPYAMHHHQGTRPHNIEGPLEFPGRRGMVRVQRVSHPGTRPNPFLEDALPAFMAARDIPSLVR
jgi:hypothetical protein